MQHTNMGNEHKHSTRRNDHRNSLSSDSGVLVGRVAIAQRERRCCEREHRRPRLQIDGLFIAVINKKYIVHVHAHAHVSCVMYTRITRRARYAACYTLNSRPRAAPSASAGRSGRCSPGPGRRPAGVGPRVCTLWRHYEGLGGGRRGSYWVDRQTKMIGVLLLQTDP